MLEKKGSILVGGNDTGQLTLGYRVTANGGQISSAGLYFNGVAFGEGAIASVLGEFFTDPAGTALPGNNLEVLSSGGGVTNGTSDTEIDFTVFDQTHLSLRVRNDIEVAGNGGIFGSISVVEQNFQTVPEPSTAALIGFGIVGVGAWRLRNRRRH